MFLNINGLEKEIFTSEKAKDSNHPHLYEAMSCRDGWAYLIQGNLTDDLIALIPDSKNSKFLLGKYYFTKNSTHVSNNDLDKFFSTLTQENHEEICLDSEALSNLVNVFAMQKGKSLVDKKNLGGSPTKYSMEDAKRWYEMRKHGKSIADIQAIETDKNDKPPAKNTILTWIKKYEAHSLIDKPLNI